MAGDRLRAGTLGVLARLRQLTTRRLSVRTPSARSGVIAAESAGAPCPHTPAGHPGLPYAAWGPAFVSSCYLASVGASSSGTGSGGFAGSGGGFGGGFGGGGVGGGSGGSW